MTDDFITSLLYGAGTIQRCIGEPPYFFPYKNFDYWKRDRDTTTKQNSAISTSKWNYSLLYSHFAWDEDSEQTHAQLHGLVCTQGSATCIASWALLVVSRKKCKVVAPLDNEKIQVTFSYQHKEGKLTKIERKRRNMLVGIKIHKESILFIPLIISYFSLTTNLHFLKQGRPSHRNMNNFMSLPLFMFCRSHCANQSFKFILQVPFKSSVSKRINSRVEN